MQYRAPGRYSLVTWHVQSGRREPGHAFVFRTGNDHASPPATHDVDAAVSALPEIGTRAGGPVGATDISLEGVSPRARLVVRLPPARYEETRPRLNPAELNAVQRRWPTANGVGP